MNNSSDWPRIAVIGAGAVGGYFGGVLARAGAPVTMIGRAPFVEAVRRSGLFLDTLQFQEAVPVEASTEIAAAAGAGLVLFCVKTTDNASTARALASHLGRDATVISLQNGVDNVDQIRAASGIEALAAVVYVAASVPEPGRVKHVGRGDLVIGNGGGAERLASTFTSAGIGCRISDNIQGELWVKLIANCGLNAISALGQVRYGPIAADAGGRKMVAAVVEEVLAVARAAGIVLPGIDSENAAIAGALKIAIQMPDAFSSTAQDLFRGRRTEIESLNGYIARRGAELGVAVPVNQALYTLVRLRSEG